MYLEFFMISEVIRKEVDLILKMTYTFVRQIKYICIKIQDWKSFGDRCFVMPLKNKDTLRSQKEQDLIGILKIGNSSLKALNINPGDTVGFTPGSEWDFIIDDQRVYCMKSNDIVIKYEHKRNQEEYNPSWAKSS